MFLISFLLRRAFRAEAWQAFSAVDGKPWTQHERFAILHVSMLVLSHSSRYGPNQLLINVVLLIHYFCASKRSYRYSPAYGHIRYCDNALSFSYIVFPYHQYPSCSWSKLSLCCSSCLQICIVWYIVRERNSWTKSRLWALCVALGRAQIVRGRPPFAGRCIPKNARTDRPADRSPWQIRGHTVALMA